MPWRPEAMGRHEVRSPDDARVALAAGMTGEQEAEATSLGESAPQPAVVGNVRTGTAGWTDRTLIASRLFYPPHAKDAKSRLLHYSRHFGLVEVDATYYSILPSAVTERWATLTPTDFCFDIKAFPVLTGHPIEIPRLPRELRMRLEEAGWRGRKTASQLPPELATLLERRP